MKITLTNDDGSTVDFNDQAYTDAAVAAALAAGPAPEVPTETVHVSEGESVEVVADVPVETPA